MPAVTNPANVAQSELEFAYKSENENDAHQEADHEAADGEELAATAHIGDVAERRPAPHFRKQQNESQRDNDRSHVQ